MDQYRTWLSGLKRALLYQDDLTLTSSINIMPTIFSGIPEEIRGSTFVGQPGLRQSLLNLQRALGSGQNTHELKTALSCRIWLWEHPQPPPIAAALPSLNLISPLSCPSPSSSGSIYSSAEAVDLTGLHIASQNTGSDAGKVGHCQSVSDENLKVSQEMTFHQIPAPDGQRETVLMFPFDHPNVRDLPLWVPTAVEVKLPPRDGFGPPFKPHTKPSVSAYSSECARRREGSSHSLDESKRFRNSLIFQDAVADRTAAKGKNKDPDSSENFPAEIKYNVDPHNLKMGQEDVRLTQAFTGQQHLAAKYQELDTFVMSWQERDDEWKERLARDTDWRNEIEGKLQTILDLLSCPVPTAVRTIAGNNFGPSFGGLSDYNRGFY